MIRTNCDFTSPDCSDQETPMRAGISEMPPLEIMT